MTREEAIQFLDNIKHEETGRSIDAEGFYLDLIGYHIQALNIAIKALWKQIPQQPTIENGFVKCPACELYIRYPIIARYNNCPECGQALKWEGEEE